MFDALGRRPPIRLWLPAPRGIRERVSERSQSCLRGLQGIDYLAELLLQSRYPVGVGDLT